MQNEQENIVYEKNINQIYSQNDIISQNLIPLINKLIFRLNELKEKKRDVLNSIKNNNEILTKQISINKTKNLLQLIQSHIQNKHEYSTSEINDIIDTFNHCIEISNNDSDIKYYPAKKHSEFYKKQIIVDYLLNMNEYEYCSKNSHKNSKFNTYVNNTLSRRGSKQIKQEHSIKIQKKKDNSNYNDSNNNIDCNVSRPFTNISSNPIIGHNDTITSYLNKKSESELTDISNYKQSIDNIKTKASIQTIKNTNTTCNRNKDPKQKLFYRNSNNNISHLKALSVEYNKNHRSMSSLSNQRKFDKTRDSLPKKKSLKQTKHAQLFININPFEKKQNKTIKKYSSVPKVKRTKSLDKNDNCTDMFSENNSYIRSANTKRLKLKINNSVRQTKKNLLQNKFSENNNNEHKSIKKNTNKRKTFSLPKQNKNTINSNISSYNKPKVMYSSPSMLNDYSIKKEKIQKKVRLARLFHILGKILKNKEKELCIQCFYDLILLNKPKLQLNIRKQRKKIFINKDNKYVLKTLLRKYIFKHVNVIMKSIVTNYNKNIKKKRITKFEKIKHNHNKSHQINKTISNKSSQKGIEHNNYNINKVKPQSHSKSKKCATRSIEKNNSCRNHNEKQFKKEQNERMNIYIPNLQYTIEDYDLLIQEPITTNNENEINILNKQTIELNNCIQTDDEIIDKTYTIELLDEQQNKNESIEIIEPKEENIKEQNLQYKLEENYQQNHIKETQSSMNGSIKLDEEAINIPDPLKNNDCKSVPTTPFNRQSTSVVGNEIESTQKIMKAKVNKIEFADINYDSNYNLSNDMYIENDSCENEEEEEEDFSYYYEGLNKLKQLNAETKQIEANMKILLQGM